MRALTACWLHLIDNFEISVISGNNQVAFFAVLRITASVLTIFAIRFVEKRVDSGSPLAIGRAMLIVTGLIAFALVGFAISPLLPVTLGLYLVINIFRSVSSPLYSGR